MNELFVAAALTFAGSVHCFGMCGGLSVAAAARGTRPDAARDFLLLQVGKGTTYAFLGALAGLFGSALVGNSWFMFTSRALAVVAALALASAGFTLLGWRPAAKPWSASVATAWSRVVGPLLSARPKGFPLVVGMSMGLLPCPLIYAGLAAAAATTSPLLGAATLAGVALGSIPALGIATITARASARLPHVRPLMAQAAGILLIVVAALTAWRAFPGAHDGHVHTQGKGWCSPTTRLSGQIRGISGIGFDSAEFS